ncbi:unnamed protein product, partial [Prorocentrum cordatum]
AQEVVKGAHAGQCWLAQETRLNPGGAAREEQRLRRQGLRGDLAPGTSRQGSLDVQQRRAASGGTGIVVRSGRGAAQPLPATATAAAEPGSSSQRVSKGRCTCLHIEGVKRRGILAASIYLDNDHLGESSWSVLRDLGRALRASGRSFVVGGGFNVGPDIFTDKARYWLEGVRGQVVSNVDDQGTCSFAEDAPPSELDFFIASLDLVHRVRSCKIIDVPAFRPHRAVALAVKQGGEEPWERRLAAPRPFPKKKPVGPVQEALQVDADVQALCERAGSQDELDKAFLGIMGHVEEELLQVVHIDPDVAHKMVGRGCEARCSWRKPPRDPGGRLQPKARGEARPLQAMAQWLRRWAVGALPDATHRGLPPSWQAVSPTAPLAPLAARAAWADALEAEANALTDAFRSS